MRTDSSDDVALATGRKVAIVCAVCGSDRVSRDAWADWDAERQQWVLGAVFDDGFCHRCEVERELVEVERATR